MPRRGGKVKYHSDLWGEAIAKRRPGITAIDSMDPHEIERVELQPPLCRGGLLAKNGKKINKVIEGDYWAS